MTNDRIQKWLALEARRQAVRTQRGYGGNPALDDAAEIIRFLAGPDGALGIADAAAARLICAECPYHEEGGLHYWEISPQQAPMELDQEEADTARDVGQTVRYLTTRGLLTAHPTNARLVRILIEI